MAPKYRRRPASVNFFPNIDQSIVPMYHEFQFPLLRFCQLFDCFFFQDQGLDFGLEVLPCTNPPGVKIFGSAPQFHAKNFSHTFYHGQDYEIPGE